MTKRHFYPQKLMLRCLALERSSYWVAMCIDLDLVAQADTAAQARKLLKDQIVTYVTDALTVDEQHANVLLKRKAPLRYRLMYHGIKLLSAHKRNQTYEAAMPLVPAGA